MPVIEPVDIENLMKRYSYFGSYGQYENRIGSQTGSSKNYIAAPIMFVTQTIYCSPEIHVCPLNFLR